MKVYRVEDPRRKHGIWRDFDGTENPVFKHLSDGKCKDIPMEDSDFYREGGKNWFSATDTPEKLKAWFSTLDVIEMEAMGYSVIEFEVTNVREVSEFEVVFTRDSILKRDYIDPYSIWEDYLDIKNKYLKDKILNKKGLTETEVKEIIHEDCDIEWIESYPYGEGRWGIIEEVIIKVNNRYFCLFYQRGKTEMQDDYFWGQTAEEVISKEVVITKWVKKEEKQKCRMNIFGSKSLKRLFLKKLL